MGGNHLKCGNLQLRRVLAIVFGAVPCARPHLPSLPVTFPPVIANPVQTKLGQHAQAEGPESDRERGPTFAAFAAFFLGRGSSEELNETLVSHGAVSPASHCVYALKSVSGSVSVLQVPFPKARADSKPGRQTGVEAKGGGARRVWGAQRARPEGRSSGPAPGA